MTYGLSKNKYSFLYDPEFTFRITVNGQLLLSKLLEMVLDGIPSAAPIMANTDGFEVMIDDADKPRYYEICAEWEAMTRLSLEYVEYDSMIIRDVIDLRRNLVNCWKPHRSRLTTRAISSQALRLNTARKVQRLSKAHRRVPVEASRVHGRQSATLEARGNCSLELGS